MDHSITIDPRRCLGCTTCMKVCPTEAIRVRRGKATVLDERCIDCARCSRHCPHKAVRAASDPLSMLEGCRYAVALPDPTLYGQFQNLDDIERILNALLATGFDSVYETAKAAGLLSDYARRYAKKEAAAAPEKKPLISSACPAVLRLIRKRFPHLISHIIPVITPMELAAILARRDAAERTGIPPEEIGVFAIVPCSAQVTAVHRPDDLQNPVIDGAISVRDMYLKLLAPMKDLRELRPLSMAGRSGVSWAFVGGESYSRQDERFLAVDGIGQVIQVLEAIEDDRIPDVDFVELSACVHGCVGGGLTVENPFVAAMHIRRLIKDLPFCRSDFDAEVRDVSLILADKELEFSPAFLLDDDRDEAMKKLQAIGRLERELPGILCGSCGAPSCHAFAEDVVLGRAERSDCIFQVRANVRAAAGGEDPDRFLPPPFRRKNT